MFDKAGLFVADETIIRVHFKSETGEIYAIETNLSLYEVTKA
jgi:hypothetical protein